MFVNLQLPTRIMPVIYILRVMKSVFPLLTRLFESAKNDVLLKPSSLIVKVNSVTR